MEGLEPSGTDRCGCFAGWPARGRLTLVQGRFLSGPSVSETPRSGTLEARGSPGCDIDIAGSGPAERSIDK